jgi:hypothetical protein
MDGTIDDFLDSLVKRSDRYSSLHIDVIHSLWPCFKDYYETYKTVKNLSPYQTISFTEAEKTTGIQGSVLHAILHDLTVDNFLVFQPYMPGVCWTVTDIGFKCFPLILDKHKMS